MYGHLLLFTLLLLLMLFHSGVFQPCYVPNSVLHFPLSHFQHPHFLWYGATQRTRRHLLCCCNPLSSAVSILCLGGMGSITYFAISGPRAWNSFPHLVADCDCPPSTHSTFWNHLKTYLFTLCHSRAWNSNLLSSAFVVAVCCLWRCKFGSFDMSHYQSRW